MIKIKLKNPIILELTASNFGNGAHIFISKKFVGKTAKIIFGNSRLINKELTIDFFQSEILERKIKPFGTGAHTIIPKKYCNKKLKVIIKNG